MTLQYASDLHLEFPKNRDFLKENPILPKAEILILAGDIMPFSQIEKYDYFFDYLAANFTRTYWLPGNHEYYGGDVLKDSGTINREIRSTVYLINNNTVVEGNTTLVFTTLWTHITPVNQYQIQQQLNDFNLIKYGTETFTAFHYNRLYQENMDFLKKALSNNTTEKTVIITHHVPTFLKYPEMYKNDPLNEAFAVELFDFIMETKPDYWIFGHHHTNIPNFKIGNTQLCTNQLGYVDYNEHKGFDPEKTILV